MISIVGTNGFLSNELGLYCNANNIKINSFGRRQPLLHEFDKFQKIDLINENLDIKELSKSELIIYSCGAGIQSNLKETSESVYKLNVFLPIEIHNELNKLNFSGTFVTFGSCFEIGNNSEDYKFTEREVASSILDVPNDYCISKRLLTRFVSSKQNKTFKHLHLILPTIYGEKEAPHRLIPYTVASIKNKESMKFTSGEQIRQYLYAGDIPKIIFQLISAKSDGVFNLSGVETYSVRNIIEQIYAFYGVSINEDLFGQAGRADVGMKNLQLDGSLIDSIVPSFEYRKFDEILKLYDKCY